MTGACPEQPDAGTELASVLAPAAQAMGAHRTTAGAARCLLWRATSSGARLRVTWGGSLHLAELVLIKDHDKNTQTMCVKGFSGRENRPSP